MTGRDVNLRGVRNEAMRELIRRARTSGWTVTMTRGQHVRFQAPDGTVVHTSFTVGGHKSCRRTEAALIRAGFPRRNR